MRVTVNGKRWLVRFVPRLANCGDCDPPDAKGKTIRIQAGMQPQLELDTVIHELMHAGNWSLSEEHVNQVATDIAAALWKLGYRKV